MNKDREEILKEATKRHYIDHEFHILVDEAVMITLSKVVVPEKHEEIVDAARISASVALIIAERQLKNEVQ